MHLNVQQLYCKSKYFKNNLYLSVIVAKYHYMSSLIELFKSITLITAETEEKLTEIISTCEISKNDFFLREGQTPRTIGFVKSGLFRYYYSNKEGVEFTKGFIAENNILSSYSALIENRESYFYIQALENSVIEQINYQLFNKYFSNTLWFKDIVILLLQKAYCFKEERERQFLLFDAEERYVSFFNRYPGLDKRIKQHIIASFLGITPESLSRIRKKMGLLT